MKNPDNLFYQDFFICSKCITFIQSIINRAMKAIKTLDGEELQVGDKYYRVQSNRITENNVYENTGKLPEYSFHSREKAQLFLDGKNIIEAHLDRNKSFYPDFEFEDKRWDKATDIIAENTEYSISQIIMEKRKIFDYENDAMHTFHFYYTIQSINLK